MVLKRGSSAFRNIKELLSKISATFRSLSNSSSQLNLQTQSSIQSNQNNLCFRTVWEIGNEAKKFQDSNSGNWKKWIESPLTVHNKVVFLKSILNMYVIRFLLHQLVKNYCRITQTTDLIFRIPITVIVRIFIRRFSHAKTARQYILPGRA